LILDSIDNGVFSMSFEFHRVNKLGYNNISVV
jgi:hypothetical protein